MASIMLLPLTLQLHFANINGIPQIRRINLYLALNSLMVCSPIGSKMPSTMVGIFDKLKNCFFLVSNFGLVLFMVAYDVLMLLIYLDLYMCMYKKIQVQLLSFFIIILYGFDLYNWVSSGYFGVQKEFRLHYLWCSPLNVVITSLQPHKFWLSFEGWVIITQRIGTWKSKCWVKNCRV